MLGVGPADRLDWVVFTGGWERVPVRRGQHSVPVPPSASHTHSKSFLDDPTLMSRYILMCSVPIHPPVTLELRQMLWSPGSCDENVNRPSEGPRVFTTMWPELRSWERQRGCTGWGCTLGCWRTEELEGLTGSPARLAPIPHRPRHWSTHLDVDLDAKVRLGLPRVCGLIPHQRLVVACVASAR